MGVDKPARKGEEQAFTVAVHVEHPQVILPCGTSLASNTDTANMAYNREARFLLGSLWWIKIQRICKAFCFLAPTPPLA